MSTAITLPADYGYVILGLGGIMLQYQLSSRFVISLRKQLKVEYPDMGTGIYAQKLSEKDWVKFNSAVRVQLNYLEQLPNVLFSTALAGLFHPKLAAGLAAAYVVGREVYIHGYAKESPKARVRGMPILFTSYVALFGVAMHGAAKSVGLF
ncbi:Microsomal glutathione S-transferase 3 [Blastocladiella emersonii ATCC 22665]|nr:Microsomal glutathione S-transferase 3 [Blastocladiella emersonii ATCC 22665]